MTSRASEHQMSPKQPEDWDFDSFRCRFTVSNYSDSPFSKPRQPISTTYSRRVNSSILENRIEFAHRVTPLAHYQNIAEGTSNSVLL